MTSASYISVLPGQAIIVPAHTTWVGISPNPPTSAFVPSSRSSGVSVGVILSWKDNMTQTMKMLVAHFSTSTVVKSQQDPSFNALKSKARSLMSQAMGQAAPGGQADALMGENIQLASFAGKDDVTALAIMTGVSDWQGDGTLGFGLNAVAGVQEHGFRVLFGGSGGVGPFFAFDVKAITPGDTAWPVETFPLSLT